MEHGQMEFLRDGLSNKDCLIPAVTQTFFDLVKIIPAVSYRNFGGAFFARGFIAGVYRATTKAPEKPEPARVCSICLAAARVVPAFTWTR